MVGEDIAACDAGRRCGGCRSWYQLEIYASAESYGKCQYGNELHHDVLLLFYGDWVEHVGFIEWTRKGSKSKVDVAIENCSFMYETTYL